MTLSLQSTSRAAHVRPAPLASLTGLRAVAAGVVFLYHLRNMGYFTDAPQTLLTTFFGGGASAVSLFFILSGFVLGWSHQSGTPILTTWWNRFVRIYPLHLVALALALIVAATAYPGIHTSDPFAGLANVFLVSSWRADWWQAGNPVSWSLVCEAFFYVTFPYVYRALIRLGPMSVAATAVVCVGSVWLIPLVLPVLAPAVSSYSNPLARLPEFVLGVALAILMRHHGWAGVRLIVATPLALIGYALACVGAATPYGAAAFTVLGFALVISGLARADMKGARTGLGYPLMVRLGKLSFAFYLVHLLALQTVLGMLQPATLDQPTATGAALAAALVAVVIAVVLHHAIEAPVVRAFAKQA